MLGFRILTPVSVLSSAAATTSGGHLVRYKKVKPLKDLQVLPAGVLLLESELFGFFRHDRSLVGIFDTVRN